MFLVVNATNQGNGIQLGVFGQQGRILGNLHDQLSCRSNNQGTGFTNETLFINRIAQEISNNGGKKGSRFAGTSLGFAGHVITLQGNLQAAFLNRGAKLEA